MKVVPEGSKGLKNVRFRRVQEGSRRFTKVQEGSRRFKKVQEGGKGSLKLVRKVKDAK